MTRDQRRRVVLIPLAVWAVLALLAGMTVGYSYWPNAPLKTGVQLAVAAASAVLITTVFMGLHKGVGIVRFAAAAGLVWGSFLYILSFADVTTR